MGTGVKGWAQDQKGGHGFKNAAHGINRGGHGIKRLGMGSKGWAWDTKGWVRDVESGYTGSTEGNLWGQMEGTLLSKSEA